MPPRAGPWPDCWIVRRALTETEIIAKTPERLPRRLRAAIRRACRNLARDVRGLARLLEGRGGRP